MADSKKTEFFKIPNSETFLVKISWIGPWVSGLIDAKGIDVAQPIWLRVGHFGIFFAPSHENQSKLLIKDGSKFDDYPGLQQNSKCA